jgi:protein-disulfide isomerase
LKTQKILSALATAAFLLAACTGPQATPEPPQTAIVQSSPAECRVVNLLQAPDVTTQALYPPPSKSDWSKGPENAPVTFMEYSDFQ